MSEAAGSARRTPELVRVWSRTIAASRRGWSAAAALSRRPSLLSALDDLGTHPRAGIALVHAAALLVASVFIALEPPGSSGRWLPGATLIAVGLSGLRIASVDRRLTRSTLLLDGVGTALLLASTGAPGSPFSFIALAGTWWATRLPGRSARDYAIPFAIAYTVLVAPAAIEDRALILAAEELIIVLLVGLLAQRMATGSHLTAALKPMESEMGSATGPNVADEPSTHSVAPGTDSDWTRADSELMILLATGLTNRELAAALRVSQSTVQRRLTRLYLALGVRGRQGAVARARALGRSVPTAVPAVSRRPRRAAVR